MNTQLIKDYLSAYKNAFGRINQEKIYKWRAIKHFQENFDLEAPDLAANIDYSMQETKNLLASGKYWPLRMLRKNAERAPERVREMLRILFDEDFDLRQLGGDFRDSICSARTIRTGQESLSTEASNYRGDFVAVGGDGYALWTLSPSSRLIGVLNQRLSGLCQQELSRQSRGSQPGRNYDVAVRHRMPAVDGGVSFTVPRRLLG